MSIKGVVSVSQERRVSHQLSARTLQDIKQWEENQIELKKLEAAQKVITDAIAARFAKHDPEALDAGVDLGDGYKVKKIGGKYKVLNRKQLLDAGILEQVDAAFEEKDKAAHIRITTPRVKGE